MVNNQQSSDLQGKIENAQKKIEELEIGHSKAQNDQKR